MSFGDGLKVMDIHRFNSSSPLFFAEPRIGPDQGATDKEEEIFHALFFQTKKLIG